MKSGMILSSIVHFAQDCFVCLGSCGSITISYTVFCFCEEWDGDLDWDCIDSGHLGGHFGRHFGRSAGLTRQALEFRCGVGKDEVRLIGAFSVYEYFVSGFECLKNTCKFT